MLTLFYAPATCALASHIALEDAGADYVARRVDFRAGEQRSPEYLAVNPKGRVPALAADRGILTETPAILAYIAQTYPQARPRAARRPVRLRAIAGVQRLSLLDRSCRPCASPARRALGGRAVLARGHEAQGDAQTWPTASS